MDCGLPESVFRPALKNWALWSFLWGPGNTDKQLQMMMDMKTTVLGSTSSYALLLAEEIEKRGIKDKIHLKKGIMAPERWGEKK